MSYIGQGLPADSFQGFTTDSFTGDGSATTFTLSKKPFDESALLVVINNVVQKPTTNFTVSGTTLTIVGTAVASGDVIYAIHMGGPLPVGGASELDLNGASDKLILDADADTTISADTDDQIDIKLGGTDFMSLATTGATVTTSGSAANTLELKSTNADANVGPIIKLTRDSASPADGDTYGSIDFFGDNDAGESTRLVDVFAVMSDVSDSAESGRLSFRANLSGTMAEMMRMQHIGSAGSNTGEVVINEDSNDINFRVESNGNDSMFKVDANAISGNGSVGVGAINTSRTFNVTTPSSYSQFTTSFMNESSSAPYGLYIKYDASPDSGADYQFIDCTDGTATRFIVFSDGDVKNHDNSYGATSDERIKQDITDANSQWDDIKALKVRNFKMKDDIRQHGADKAKTLIGLVAQELESVSPNLVDEAKPNPSNVLSSSEFGTLYQDGDDIPEGKEIGDVKEVKENVKGIKYSVLYMKAIKALQEAMAKIETLETKVKALEDA